MPASPPPPAVLIRPFRREAPEDRAAVRQIAWETAFLGNPADAFFEDRELLADLLTAYYTDAEPESLFVAEAAGRIVGYFAGCARPDALRRFYRRRAPGLAGRLICRLPFRPRMRRFCCALLRDLAAGRLRPPAGLEREYPGHHHRNVQAGWRGRGIGSRLLAAGLERMRALGLPGVHARHHLLDADLPDLRLKVRLGYRIISESQVRYWEPFLGRSVRVVYLGLRF